MPSGHSPRACNGAALIRGEDLKLVGDPASATHRFALHRARDDG
jgi:hypothetical protein